MSYAPHSQTKNAHTDTKVVSAETSAPLEYGKFVSGVGVEKGSVSLHDGTAKTSGVVYTGRFDDDRTYPAGECVDVQYTGTVIVKAAVAITKGDAVSSDAAGDAIVHVPGTNAKAGQAEEDAVVGQFFSVYLSEQS